MHTPPPEKKKLQKNLPQVLALDCIHIIIPHDLIAATRVDPHQ